MSRFVPFIAILSLSSSPSFAQQPAPKGDAAKGDAKLDDLLRGWEKALGGITSLSMECERTTVDKIFESTENFKGTIKLMKPADAKQGFRASLEMFKIVGGKPAPNRFEKFIVTGTALYEYDPANKVIRKHAMALGKAGQGDDNVLSFIFGKKAGDLFDRYRFSSVPSKKDDKYYFYIQIEPKHEQDKADFTVAHVALYKSNLLTAMVSYRQPNGNEVTWTFTKIETNAKFNEKDFAPPEPPPGWKLQIMPAR